MKKLLLLLTAIFLLSCSKDDICECELYPFQLNQNSYRYADCRMELWIKENLNGTPDDFTIYDPELMYEYIEMLNEYECNP